MSPTLRSCGSLLRVVAALVVASMLAPTGPAHGQAPARGTTFTYDANGNRTSMLEDGVLWTYVYDVRDRLVEVRRDGELVESYGYDFLDRRLVKRGGGQLTRYLWDDDRLLAELDVGGSTVARYEHLGRRLLSADHSEEGRGFYLFDASRSPTGILGADGILRARHSWDAWGGLRRTVGDSSSPFGFTGHQLDELTGLHYAGARYYDAQLGIFLGEDPLLGELDTPASLHRYLYAYANPTVYWDPDGRESIRQLLDPESDFMAGRLVRGSAKFYAYNLWNVFTLGFVGEHDEIYETSSGGDYALGTALALGKTGAKAYVAAQTAGTGLAVSQAAGLGALASGAVAGAAAGLAETATDDLFRVVEGDPTHPLRDYVAVTAGGAAVGGVGGRLAAPGPARAPPPALDAAAVRARVLGSIAESQAARQAGRFGDYVPRTSGVPPNATILGESSSAPGVRSSTSAWGGQPPHSGSSGVPEAGMPDLQALLQRLTTKQSEILGADPSIARTVLSPAEYAAAQRSYRVAPMQYGNALERLTKRSVRGDSLADSWIVHVGGPNRPDFIGRPGTLAEGMNFDITTTPQIRAHLARRKYGLGLQVITYERPRGFRLFP